MKLQKKKRFSFYFCLSVSLLILLNFILIGGVHSFNLTQSDRPVPLLDNLGNHHHEITTHSPQAQAYFDQGLTLVFGFNHAEAFRSFQQAAKLDPDCAMCYAGMALALGPNINAPMGKEAMPTAYQAIEQARQLSAKASPHEQAYINAIAQRYSPQPVDDRSSLDLAYANAMGKLVEQYPEDLDGATLYAEALMDLMPWNYWLEGGEPKPETQKIVQTLESVLAKNPQHPGATHYYIHAVEASNHPEKAEAAADNLRGLIPGSGHLVHMPSHIYYRIGRYHDAALVNQDAIKSDESYLANAQEQELYSALYYPHNIHFLWLAASMEGRSKEAIAAARKLVTKVSASQVQALPFAEIFLPTPYFALVQFGQWDEVLTEPKPSADFPYTTTMWHYARGMAWAAKGELDQVLTEQQQLQRLLANHEFTALETAGIPATQLVQIADELLNAKIAKLKNQNEAAIAYYQEAVKRQDNLPYMEPPYWYYPIRQSLGATLAQQGKFPEAEAAYRQDLQQHPNNGWSLFGLVQTLKAQDKQDAAKQTQQRFQDAWSQADFELTLSQF